MRLEALYLEGAPWSGAISRIPPAIASWPSERVPTAVGGVAEAEYASGSSRYGQKIQGKSPRSKRFA